MLDRERYPVEEYAHVMPYEREAYAPLIKAARALIEEMYTEDRDMILLVDSWRESLIEALKFMENY